MAAQQTEPAGQIKLQIQAQFNIYCVLNSSYRYQRIQSSGIHVSHVNNKLLCTKGYSKQLFRLGRLSQNKRSEKTCIRERLTTAAWKRTLALLDTYIDMFL